MRVGLSVCVYVSCLLSHTSPLECLIVLKSMSHTQRKMKVKIIVGFSLKLLVAEIQHPLHCMAIRVVGHFKNACANERGVSTYGAYTVGSQSNGKRNPGHMHMQLRRGFAL